MRPKSICFKIHQVPQPRTDKSRTPLLREVIKSFFLDLLKTRGDLYFSSISHKADLPKSKGVQEASFQFSPSSKQLQESRILKTITPPPSSTKKHTLLFRRLFLFLFSYYIRKYIFTLLKYAPNSVTNFNF